MAGVNVNKFLNETPRFFKYYSLLSMFYTTVLLLSVLLDYKFIEVGPFFASAATFVISLTFFLNDVIAEVYGYQRARYIIWASLLCLILFSSLGFFLNKIPTPVEYQVYGESYHTVFSLLFRASIANSIAILLGSFVNIYIVSIWKILVKGKYFWLRCLGSSIVGEAIYTITVVCLINLGVVPFAKLIQILIVSYGFKLVFNFIAVIPSSILAEFLKKKENIDAYDYGLDYSPFKFDINSKVSS